MEGEHWSANRDPVGGQGTRGDGFQSGVVVVRLMRATIADVPAKYTVIIVILRHCNGRSEFRPGAPIDI
jgi:hypothetical protein